MTSPLMILTDSDRKIYHKYASLNLPRHTSYPIAPAWSESFSEQDFVRELKSSYDPKTGFSLYFHIPYCQRLCFYCGCTKEIMGDNTDFNSQVSQKYLDDLSREMALISGYLPKPSVGQLHLGGGSPTFLNEKHLARLMDLIKQNFTLLPDAEIAVEVDPRITSKEQIQLLKDCGFNRMSLGVQDFAENVQKAVNRYQPYEKVLDFLAMSRKIGFDSINFDLIYGLPFQTMASMEDTLKKVLTLKPDRIAFYRLAHIPDMFKWQKTFKKEDMPGIDLMADLFIFAHNVFVQNGYTFVGLDHFALTDELLSVAKEHGTVQRNFQGITTGKSLPILGLGPSAISHFTHAFSQNLKKTSEWSESLNQGRLAIERGMVLSQDDLIRAEVLQQLYCYAFIDKKSIEEKFNIIFDDYFKEELVKLIPYTADGLVELHHERIVLTTNIGRILARVVASVFDVYYDRLQRTTDPKARVRFSSVG